MATATNEQVVPSVGLRILEPALFIKQCICLVCASVCVRSALLNIARLSRQKQKQQGKNGKSITPNLVLVVIDDLQMKCLYDLSSHFKSIKSNKVCQL